METVRGPAWVKYVVDYAGLVAFAGAYFVTRDLMQASWGLAIGSVGGLAVGLIVQRKIAPLPLITGALAILFAGLALVFHDAIFIKMKLTIVDGLLAAALLGGLAMGKQPLKAVLGEALKLTDATWRKLVFFRFPGVPILAVLFSFSQVPLMMKDLKAQEEAEVVPPPPPAD